MRGVVGVVGVCYNCGPFEERWGALGLDAESQVEFLDFLSRYTHRNCSHDFAECMRRCLSDCVLTHTTPAEQRRRSEKKMRKKTLLFLVGLDNRTHIIPSADNYLLDSSTFVSFREQIIICSILQLFWFGLGARPSLFMQTF